MEVLPFDCYLQQYITRSRTVSAAPFTKDLPSLDRHDLLDGVNKGGKEADVCSAREGGRGGKHQPGRLVDGERF